MQRARSQGCRGRALRGGLGGKPPALLRQAGAAAAANRPRAPSRRPPPLREMRDEQRRRHRHLPQHLHDLHRFRLRPDQGRGRLSLLDADRHRHHVGGPVLGLGRRRGHPPAPGEEDPLHRLLRLHHHQLQQPLRHRLQQLRRPRPEGRRLDDLDRHLSAARPSRPGRSRRRPAAARRGEPDDGLHQLLRELRPDRGADGVVAAWC